MLFNNHINNILPFNWLSIICTCIDYSSTHWSRLTFDMASWPSNLVVPLFIFRFNYFIFPFETCYEVLYNFFAGLFSLWNSKFCQKSFNLEGKRNSLLLFIFTSLHIVLGNLRFVVKICRQPITWGGIA